MIMNNITDSEKGRKKQYEKTPNTKSSDKSVTGAAFSKIVTASIILVFSVGSEKHLEKTSAFAILYFWKLKKR